MTNQKEIIEILKSGDALSAKGISARAKIDADSGDLRKIEGICWALVLSGNLVAIDRREEVSGALFFQKA